jgi:pre-mRNA-processing factor 6
MQGLKLCPSSVPLWTLLIQLEERVKGATKARPTAELARMKLPANELIWLESVRLERRAGSEKLAGSVPHCMQMQIVLSSARLFAVVLMIVYPRYGRIVNVESYAGMPEVGILVGRGSFALCQNCTSIEMY